MASPEDKAYEIMRELDVGYVLVIFGGLTGYSSDGKYSTIYLSNALADLRKTICHVLNPSKNMCKLFYWFFYFVKLLCGSFMPSCLLTAFSCLVSVYSRYKQVPVDGTYRRLDTRGCPYQGARLLYTTRRVQD